MITEIGLLSLCSIYILIHYKESNTFNYRDLAFTEYEGVSKSFRTESTKQQTLVGKQHKGLWRQNSLDWLTK
jgi:hypothetical protein